MNLLSQNVKTYGHQKTVIEGRGGKVIPVNRKMKSEMLC